MVLDLGLWLGICSLLSQAAAFQWFLIDVNDSCRPAEVIVVDQRSRWSESGSKVSKRRKMLVMRRGRFVPRRPNEEWCMDFVADQLTNGQREHSDYKRGFWSDNEIYDNSGLSGRANG